jgi:UPF0716 protein FxsA
MLFYLILLFVTMPLLEIALLIKISEVLRLSGTLVLVIATGILGASLAKWQGTRQLLLIQEELNHGRIPGRSLVDGVLILIAGLVLLTPGVITDAGGFFLLVPPGRAVVRRQLLRWMERHVQTRVNVIDVGSWSEPPD